MQKFVWKYEEKQRLLLSQAKGNNGTKNKQTDILLKTPGGPIMVMREEIKYTLKRYVLHTQIESRIDLISKQSFTLEIINIRNFSHCETINEACQICSIKRFC